MIHKILTGISLFFILVHVPLVLAITSTVCGWSGTAPFCNGMCSGAQQKLPSPHNNCGTGSCCATGSKALCCQLPSCPSGFEWAQNDAQLDPCFLASQIAAACAPADQQEILVSNGNSYAPPTMQNQNVCTCSSPLYALISACSYCQNGTFVDWKTWSSVCNGVHLTAADLKGSVNGIPDLPPWSLLDITKYPKFDPVVANDIALGLPVSASSTTSSATAPSSRTSSTTSASTQPTHTQSLSSSSSSTDIQPTSISPTSTEPADKKPITAGIVGGTLGGLILFLIAVIWCLATANAGQRQRLLIPESQRFIADDAVMNNDNGDLDGRNDYPLLPMLNESSQLPAWDGSDDLTAVDGRAASSRISMRARSIQPDGWEVMTHLQE